MLSVTDGLFRETVRAVPLKAEGKYDSVKVLEQLVDSAVYKYVCCLSLLYPLDPTTTSSGSSVTHENST